MAISQLINRGTVKTFKATGGDVAITISSGTTLATGAGAVSARLDLGTFPRTNIYEWQAKAKFGTAPTLAATVALYWSNSDGTYQDGNLGTSAVALSSTNKLNNLKQIGNILIDISNTTDYMYASGTFSTTARYGSLVVVNNSGQAMNDFEFVLTEILQQPTAS